MKDIMNCGILFGICSIPGASSGNMIGKVHLSKLNSSSLLGIMIY